MIILTLKLNKHEKMTKMKKFGPENSSDPKTNTNFKNLKLNEEINLSKL